VQLIAIHHSRVTVHFPPLCLFLHFSIFTNHDSPFLDPIHFSLFTGHSIRYIESVQCDGIEIDPKIMMGKPVIRGTRITVELILRKLSEGATEADLLEAYPRLTREDIHAAMRYAADTLAHEEIAIPPST